MEELTADKDEATRLHYDADAGCVWLDTDIGEQDGLVVGVGSGRLEAVADALKELRSRVRDLEGVLWAEAQGAGLPKEPQA